MEYSNNLPPEIIEIVLLKLPVKSLLRFKTVCTSWNTIISDPVFTRIHLENSNNSPNNNDNLFITEKGDTERGFSLFKLEGGKLHADRVSENPSGNMVILCECNGVLLLRDSSGGVNNTSNYVLWNPSTRRVRCFNDPYGSTVNYGLCYDPITDDFKVVVMKRSSYSIFSCNSDSWTEVEESRSYDSVGWSGVFADGALYWLFCFEMARFDPETDELEALRKPEQLGDYDEFSLGRLRGRLCLYCNNTGDDERGIRIWIKEKNSNDWEAFVAIENVPTDPIAVWIYVDSFRIGIVCVFQLSRQRRLLVT
ncbi:hypothetical protein MIMGU_mgv1a025224mg [Erythranthe guttata]|uniref:F-box domain-containing protein n=1 Tax=Erythranthe guttata TaxID=4155 RepID=A0A022QDJ7_ERYGU|nr:hypothetical protein MIMGU_mgv1a025224mg [Erythranthe guttata]